MRRASTSSARLAARRAAAHAPSIGDAAAATSSPKRAITDSESPPWPCQAAASSSRSRSTPGARRARTGIGSAGPTPLRAREAEDYLGGELDEAAAWHGQGGLSESVIARFGELVAAAASPIDDVRGSAAYRRHALGVLARRTLRWSLAELEQPRAA